ncbi:hypothetical protein V3C99_004586 [Haemonchus contortus]
MSFSSSELNHLIWKYLHETGMVHSAFVFGVESEAANSNLVDSEVPSGALVSIVQKGLCYIEAEARASNEVMNSKGKGEDTGSMSLIDGAARLYRLTIDSSKLAVNPSSQGAANEDDPAEAAAEVIVIDDELSPPYPNEHSATFGLYDKENDGAIPWSFPHCVSRSGPLESLPSGNNSSKCSTLEKVKRKK